MVKGKVSSGSQQQYLARNSQVGGKLFLPMSEAGALQSKMDHVFTSVVCGRNWVLAVITNELIWRFEIVVSRPWFKLLRSVGSSFPI